MSQIITLEDYFTLHGAPESQALRDNAIVTVDRADAVLQIAVAEGFSVTNDQLSKNPVASGHRPAGVNAATANAATASTHLTDEGIDIQDVLDGTRWLAVWCIENLDVLERVGLWMEDPRWTGGRVRPDGQKRDPWCHWQTKPPRSGRRVYVPSSAPPTDPDFYVRFRLSLPK